LLAVQAHQDFIWFA